MSNEEIINFKLPEKLCTLSIWLREFLNLKSFLLK